MKNIAHELAIAVLWAIGIIHTVVFVKDARVESILITLFAVLMFGSIQIVRLAKRK